MRLIHRRKGGFPAAGGSDEGGDAVVRRWGGRCFCIGLEVAVVAAEVLDVDAGVRRALGRRWCFWVCSAAVGDTVRGRRGASAFGCGGIAHVGQSSGGKAKAVRVVVWRPLARFG